MVRRRMLTMPLIHTVAGECYYNVMGWEWVMMCLCWVDESDTGVQIDGWIDRQGLQAKDYVQSTFFSSLYLIKLLFSFPYPHTVDSSWSLACRYIYIHFEEYSHGCVRILYICEDESRGRQFNTSKAYSDIFLWVDIKDSKERMCHPVMFRFYGMMCLISKCALEIKQQAFEICTFAQNHPRFVTMKTQPNDASSVLSSLGTHIHIVSHVECRAVGLQLSVGQSRQLQGSSLS